MCSQVWLEQGSLNWEKYTLNIKEVNLAIENMMLHKIAKPDYM